MGTLPAGLICGRSAGSMYFRFFRSKGMGAIVILYFADLFDALVRNKNGIVALLSIIAAFVQLIGYGTGFLEAIWREGILRKKY